MNKNENTFDICRRVAITAIEEERIFTLKEIISDVRKEGGIPIMQPGLYLFEYLDRLVHEKKLFFDKQTEKYYPYHKQPERWITIPADRVKRSLEW
jgi:hypothetical protein